MSRLVKTIIACPILVATLWGMSLAQSQAGVRTVALTRALHIQVALQNAEGAGGQDPATLLVSPGAHDEPPEGPDAFDVLDDGRIAIADPLRRRITVFDARGNYLQQWPVGFPADSIEALPGGPVLIREANTGKIRRFDTNGSPRPGGSATLPEPADARLISPTVGTVQRPAADGFEGGPLQVQFDRPGARLLSLESLGSDRQGNTYVALETTTGASSGEVISVQKYVRRYDAAGRLVSEIADIPLDYYFAPTDELRVHNGVVYQLMPLRTEIRINVWDAN